MTRDEIIALIRNNAKSNSYLSINDALMLLEYEYNVSTDQTIAASCYYVNSVTGNDSNDGLSAIRAKKTLAAGIAAIPYVLQHNVVLHLSGTFTDFGTQKISKITVYGTQLIVDGGSGVTVIDDNSGSNYTADSSSTSAIADSLSAAWSVDEHAGYWIEILTGDAAGDIRLVYSNDATGVVPSTNFSADPGTGATFRIVRPSTTLNATSASMLSNSTSGAGTFRFQNLYLSGKTTLSVESQAATTFSRIVSDSTESSEGSLSLNSGTVFITSNYYSPTTFTADSGHPGVSCRDSNGYFNAKNVTLMLSNSVIKLASIANCSLLVFHSLRTQDGMTLYRTFPLDPSAPMFYTGVSGTRDSKFDASSLSGLYVLNSHCSLMSGIDVSDCTTHGIEVDNGRLDLMGVVTGTGNTGAGVYAHNNSLVTIVDGFPPTLTGGVGNLAISDPASQESTWAAIDGATPAAVLNELTVAKEV